MDSPSSQSMRTIDPDTRPPSSGPNGTVLPGSYTTLRSDQFSSQVSQPSKSSKTPTQPRVLAGIRVEGDEVDGMFKLQVYISQGSRPQCLG